MEHEELSKLEVKKIIAQEEIQRLNASLEGLGIATIVGSMAEGSVTEESDIDIIIQLVNSLRR